MRHARRTLGLLIVVTLACAPGSAWSQKLMETRTYGTADLTVHSLSAWAFTGLSALDNGVTMSTPEFDRFCSTACTFMAPLMLPAGALLLSFDVEACDTHPTGVLTVRLFRKSIGGNPVELASASTSNVPHCGLFAGGVLNPAVTVDNVFNNYFILVSLTGGDNRVKLSSVKVAYRLQVSPAPSAATFTDVPTNHPFFQFIEAMADAGITTGCNAPGDPARFCPDNFVTRGQMAAFFSRALGLHFPF